MPSHEQAGTHIPPYPLCSLNHPASNCACTDILLQSLDHVMQSASSFNSCKPINSCKPGSLGSCAQLLAAKSLCDLASSPAALTVPASH